VHDTPGDGAADGVLRGALGQFAQGGGGLARHRRVDHALFDHAGPGTRYKGVEKQILHDVF
jgi:hypothetical protein